MVNGLAPRIDPVRITPLPPIDKPVPTQAPGFRATSASPAFRPEHRSSLFPAVAKLLLDRPHGCNCGAAANLFLSIAMAGDRVCKVLPLVPREAAPGLAPWVRVREESMRGMQVMHGTDADTARPKMKNNLGVHDESNGVLFRGCQ